MPAQTANVTLDTASAFHLNVQLRQYAQRHGTDHVQAPMNSDEPMAIDWNLHTPTLLRKVYDRRIVRRQITVVDRLLVGRHFTVGRSQPLNAHCKNCDCGLRQH